LHGKEVISIFFGGGTPSLAHESVIEGVIGHIAKGCQMAQGIEITMEANPTSVEAGKFKNLALAGVNRISLGVQSLRTENLRFLGREHSVIEAKMAIEIACKSFPKYSFDLIYALPNQTIYEWEIELEEAISMASEHLSLYQLTIEKGTYFFKAYNAGEFVMPDNETAADMYTRTEDILQLHGYKAYEVSNYAKNGHECTHNMQYWRYGDYLGIGPGAHGRIEREGERIAIQNISSPEEWLKRVTKVGVGVQQENVLAKEEIAIERLLMGLRTAEGVDNHDIVRSERINELVDNGLLKLKGGRVVATRQGRLLLNSIVEYLV
jgi:oxygen-independent coproporphyrinogen-3 oxidase